MALNYSHWSMFPPHISEDSLVSPMRIVNGYFMEGGPDKNGDGYLRPWYLAQGDTEEYAFNCGRDRADFCSLQDSATKDIVDLLPSDPFGMDMQSTFTAITGWLEDLEFDYGGYMMTDKGRIGQEGFPGWDLIWNDPFGFQPCCDTLQLPEQLKRDFYSSNIQTYEQSHTGKNYIPRINELSEKLNTITGAVEEGGMGSVLAPFDARFHQGCNVGDILDFSNGSASCSLEMVSNEKADGVTNFEGMPHEALFFALSYLGLKDLLSVEMVCKSLFSTVRGDPLLWRTINIDQPLNERITDDVLVQLASRAQGNLQCLNLVECPKISDNGLRDALETNTQLTKLCVPGCTRISIECIVESMKASNCNKDGRGVKHLRIGGLFGVNHDHFEELKFLLGADEKKLVSDHKPHFYHRGNFYLPYDDERAMDIDMCPICEKFRLVYDCPAESCKVNDNSPQVCRACTLCIARCARCGTCINDTEFEETFCLDLLCSDCIKQLCKYQDKLDEVVDPCEDRCDLSYDCHIHG